MASQNAQPAPDARQRLTSTLDEIEERLSPRRIMADGLERVAASSGQLASAARDTARAHPLALAAAAVAVGLALFTSRRLSRARVDMGDELGNYTDYDDGFGFTEADAPSPAQPRRVAATETAADTEAEGEATGNPLVSILIGLAAGAALGAIFPATETERRVLGDAGSRIGDAARAAARRAVDDIGTATRR
ncbi:MAG: hypothetical protein RL480_2281 [Pseudomonadota bacterium]|jgi:hypothetical protein